ncbi:SLATT domain-containing protein [Streptomyces sparsogenes]|uniref:SLATT domain-containing protein n=1 Tax=Streptomyces sparsogenes TaxID=67365 RepID=UPI003411BEA3
MSLSDAEYGALSQQLQSMHENCLYSAQSYFEAAKGAELWGRLMVFMPACVSAISGFMTSIGSHEFWGALAAVAGAVAATASFLGATKKASDFLNSARSYTVLRHKIKLELQFLSTDMQFSSVRDRVEALNAEYMQIVSTDIPVPNRSFSIASRRIDEGAAS